MKQVLARILKVRDAHRSIDIGLLFLRVGVGLMMFFGHGWGKFFGFYDRLGKFSDPLGIGSILSQVLATSAEFFCSLAIVVGFATRLSAIPLIITMLVAALIVHSNDPWGKKELALIYFVPFLTLIVTGPGRFSMDRFISS